VVVGAPFRRDIELQAQVLPPLQVLKKKNPHRCRSVEIFHFRPEFFNHTPFFPSISYSEIYRVYGIALCQDVSHA